MKIKVNKNYIWSSVFVEQLTRWGLRQVCISPGSRNTPLTLAFINNKKIKTFVNIDERSSGFYALGLSKSSSLPVAVVTTSGTAAAELYPSIIEAYQQRIPLIICTADRPAYLKNSGANQMINQTDLYKNHIRYFKYFGLAKMNKRDLDRMLFFENKGLDICTHKNRGPVHFNFPFKKPLEQNSFTDEIEENLTSNLNYKAEIKNSLVITSQTPRIIKKIVNIISEINEGIIVAGPGNKNSDLANRLFSLSTITGYPVFADGASNLRAQNNSVIINYDSFLRSEKFKSKFKPKLVLQFGRTLTSSTLAKYLGNSGAQKYLVNEYGDLFDPTKTTKSVIRYNPEKFCKDMISELKVLKIKNQNSEWLKVFREADSISEKIKDKIIFNSKFPNESRIIEEVLKSAPSKCNLMIGNSSPIRDLDYFLSKTKKDISIYYNRGASGIDGVTSTAAGIAINKKPAVLITGDLSFIHDLNALVPAKKYSVQLLIILINNNGGGIFERLPIASDKKIFNEYFKTPHNLDLQQIVKSFEHNYVQITGWKQLSNSIKKYINTKEITVLELRTNSTSSQKLRDKYWNAVVSKVEKNFGLNEDQG